MHGDYRYDEAEEHRRTNYNIRNPPSIPSYFMNSKTTTSSLSGYSGRDKSRHVRAVNQAYSEGRARAALFGVVLAKMMSLNSSRSINRERPRGCEARCFLRSVARVRRP